MLIPTVGDPLSCGGPTLNFSLVTGDNINVSITFLQSDGVTPYNLSGWSGKMTIAFPTPQVLTTQNGGLSIPTPASGNIFVIVSSLVTASWPTGQYNYDFWLAPSGLSTPVIENQYCNGIITINASTTVVP